MKGHQAKREPGSKANKATMASITMLVLSLTVMTGAFIYNGQQSRLLHTHATYADELRILSQQIAKNASEAASGMEEAFSLLETATLMFDQYIQELNSVKPSLIPFTDSSDSPAAQQIEALDLAWSEMKAEADSILTARDTVLSQHGTATTLSETIPQLQIEYDEVVEILLENDAPAEQIAIAQRQPWLAERIIRSVAKVLEGNEDSIMAADSLSRDVKLFGRVLDGMLEGNTAMRISQVNDDEAFERLTEIADLFAFVDASVDNILATSPELFGVGTASDTLFTDSQQLLQQTSVLADTLSATNAEGMIPQLAIVVISGLALLSALLTAMSIVKDNRRRLEQTQNQNEASEALNAASQQAIVSLLDEMAELTDGDLTIKSNATEDDFTGAIADAITFSIEQLHTLVNTINHTALKVDAAARETQSTANLLAEASDHQTQEIGTATQSVNQIAESIDRISSEAANSANVAERSGQMAANGSVLVRNTMDDMTRIHGQIEDTSTRLKRLGESSREIVDMIPLINEIADQANILSLNATIRASMSGEAGRGFTVVADEVQRLAERVSATTLQIESLVSNVETETREAVSAMEQTSSEVENGTRLVQDAGTALEEIEQVSNSLAGVVRTFSEAAKNQAQSASQTANRMVAIRDISVQTSSGTRASAQSIGDLADMAKAMRQSVTGFRLPATTES